MRYTLPSICIIALFSTSTALAIPPPYTEDFEAEATCGTACGAACVLTASGWTNSTTDDLDWAVDTGGTTSGGTGPSVDHNPGNGTGNYLYIESSTPCNGSDQEAHLISPPLELLGTTTPVIQFWYHMYGGDQGTLHVDVIDQTGTVIPDVVPAVTDDQDLWQQLTVPLLAFVGQTVQVRIRGIVGNGFESDMAVDDFEFIEYTVEDLGIVSIDAPAANACGLGAAESITVTIENAGGVPASGFDVSYVLDGGAAVTETFGQTIAPFSTDTYTFTASGDFSAPGAHTLDVSVTLANDADPTNDSLSGSVFNGRLIGTFPAQEDFEGATAADWISGGTNSSWALATPANAVITGANSGANAWVTNATGNYNNDEDSYVQSTACYDLTNVGAPALNLSIWWEAETSYDGANIQYSIDGGANWVTIGTLGDPVNWYNDDTISGSPGGDQVGWTGRNGSGSDGWIVAQHDLSALAGQPSVNFRINFGSDGSVSDEGFAFDDFSVIDVPPAVDVSLVGPPPAVGAVPAGSSLVTQVLQLVGYGPGTRDIVSMNITNSGDIPDADVSLISIYADDGDGVFDPSFDTLAGTGSFVAGSSLINTTGLGVSSAAAQLVFVVVDIDPAAQPGVLVGTDIPTPSVDIVTGDASPVTGVNVLLGPQFGIQGVSGLPLVDNLDPGHPSRLAVYTAGLTFPQAATATTNVMTGGATSNDALVELLPSYSGLFPTGGASFAAISFPNGEATGAIDYVLDLSAYDAAVDPVWIGFRYTDDGEEDDVDDNVFVSLDGGATWFGSVYNFEWNNPTLTWTDQVVDLSGFVDAAGGTFTSSVVVRFQVSDNFGLGSDGFLLDSVLVGLAQEAGVERPIGFVIQDDGADMLGTVPAAPQSVVYTLRNSGHFPLTATPTTSLASNVTIDSVPGPITVAGSSTATLQLDITPGLGTFGFNLDVAVDDPRIGDGVYTIVVTGNGGQPEPEIDVQRPAGTSIASGGTDMVGDVPAGAPTTLSYVIANTSFGDLTLTSASVANESNVTATVPALSQTLGANQTTTLDVEATPTAAGSFSFDLVIESDDADEGTYTVTVSGNATAPDIEIQSGGVAIANGATDTQPVLDVGVTSSVTYAVVNNGTADLDVTSIGLTNLQNVTASTVAGGPMVLAPAEQMAVGASYTIDAAGAWSFDLVVMSNDPVDGTYVVTVAGQSSAPDIVVERGGTEVPNASTDDAGTVMVGEDVTLTYTIRNDGNQPLSLGNITAGGETNVTVEAMQALTASVAPGNSTTFDVVFSAVGDGAFSFDVSVLSNDPDEDTYAFAVSGTAEEMVTPDAGLPPKDGGTGTPDSGVKPDSGTSMPDDEDDGGCGCAAVEDQHDGTGSSLAAFLLVGLVLVRRRRKR